MSEWEFIAEVAKRCGCGLLLGLNDSYVNAYNHQFDPLDYLRGIPGERIGQFHVAGHTDMGSYLFDTHSRPVIEEVWALYEEVLRRWGPVATMIEWDEDIKLQIPMTEQTQFLFGDWCLVIGYCLERGIWCLVIS